MPITHSAISDTLDQSFRAAFLLTGSADLAENAVLKGIAGLESSDDVEKTLLAKTVESAIRQRAHHPDRLEHAVALLPDQLQRLTLLSPVSRDCFLLRILFGVPPVNCAASLNLTIEEFEDSLCTALQQLPTLEQPDVAARRPGKGAQK